MVEVGVRGKGVGSCWVTEAGPGPRARLWRALLQALAVPHEDAVKRKSEVG